MIIMLHCSTTEPGLQADLLLNLWPGNKSVPGAKHFVTTLIKLFLYQIDSAKFFRSRAALKLVIRSRESR